MLELSFFFSSLHLGKNPSENDIHM